MTDKLSDTVTSMSANIITVLRVILVFVAVGFYTLSTVFTVIAFFLTIIVIYMDSLDGYLARRLKVASEFGALLDIAGDRIVENIFWIFFAAHGDISYWVPIVIVTRGFLVDMVRSVAFSEGKTPFGKKTMMRTQITRFLVSSSFSRSFYAINKVFAFSWLGGLIALRKGIDSGFWVLSPSLMTTLFIVGQILVYTALAMCIIRGLPVLWDGREMILAKRYPKRLKDED